jgi:hypothetical protein
MHQNVNDRQQELENHYAREVFLKQVVVLRDMAVVIVGQPQVENDAQDKRQIQKCRIQPELVAKHVLNMPVDAENP